MMIGFTAQEKFDCAKRELGQRKFVYPRRVANGQMTQKLADRQIALMQAIADDYEDLAKKEQHKIVWRVGMEP